jgi:hypothetical protein
MRHLYLRLFRRRTCLLKSTASVVLLTFTWLLVHPAVLAAQMRAHGRPPAETHLPSKEAELASMLTKMEEKLTRAVLTRLDDEGVQQWRKHLAHLDVRTRETFDQMVQHLKEKGMPAELLQRHQMLVTAYDTEMATLRRHLGVVSGNQHRCSA